VSLQNLLNNMTTEQLCLVGITILCFILAFFLVKLVRGVLQTLSRLDTAADNVNSLLEDIKPVVEGLKGLEDTVNNTLSETVSRLEKFQEDASVLMGTLDKTAAAYQELERVIQKRLEEEVPPILVETKDLVSGAREITFDIQQKIKATDSLFEAVNEAGQTVKLATDIAKGGISGLAVQFASMAVGARKSLEFIAENIYTKGGKSNE